MIKRTMLALVATVLPIQANAVTITEMPAGYSFSSSVETWSTFDLDIGTNTLSGDLLDCGSIYEGPPISVGIPTICVPDAEDAFRLNLTAGQEVDSVLISSSLFRVTPMISAGMTGPRSFDFQFGRAPSQGDTFWSVEIEVSATTPSIVPLPAGLPLLLAGLTTLGLLRKSRRLS